MTETESPRAEVVHLPAQAQPVLRRDVSELADEAEQIRAMQGAVLKLDVDYGTIPGTKKPSLYKSGAEWLLKWGRFAHRFEVIDTERDEDGKRYGVTYRCSVASLDAPDVVVATCDGYCGYDEPDREEHVNSWGKAVPRSPWNTIIKMAQKRALIGATLQATGTSGLFTQDVEDYGPEKETQSAAEESQEPTQSPDEHAQSLGWKDAAELKAEHDDYIKLAKSLTPEQQADAKERKQKLGIGWPMTPEQMATMAKVLAEAVARNAEESVIIEHDCEGSCPEGTPAEECPSRREVSVEEQRRRRARQVADEEAERHRAAAKEAQAAAPENVTLAFAEPDVRTLDEVLDGEEPDDPADDLIEVPDEDAGDRPPVERGPVDKYGRPVDENGEVIAHKPPYPDDSGRPF